MSLSLSLSHEQRDRKTGKKKRLEGGMREREERWSVTRFVAHYPLSKQEEREKKKFKEQTSQGGD